MEEALAAIEEARTHVEATGDMRYLVELHRLEGDVRARLAEPRAKACFERAGAIAQEQGARWWELRARTSLVAWQRAHRKPIDAANFAAFVAGFTEGEATADLRAARRLVQAIRRTTRP